MLKIIRPLLVLHRELDVIVNLYTTANRGNSLLLLPHLLSKKQNHKKINATAECKSYNKDRFCQGECLLILEWRCWSLCSRLGSMCALHRGAQPGAGTESVLASNPSYISTRCALVQGPCHPRDSIFSHDALWPYAHLTSRACSSNPTSLLTNLKPSLGFSPPMLGGESASRLMVMTKCQQVWGALNIALGAMLGKSQKGSDEIYMVQISNSEILWPELKIRNSWLRSFWPSSFCCSYNLQCKLLRKEDFLNSILVFCSPHFVKWTIKQKLLKYQVDYTCSLVKEKS